jgi:hypothetical protein
MDNRRILTHFTNAEGLKGITELDPDGLSVGMSYKISRIGFGVGQNGLYANF